MSLVDDTVESLADEQGESETHDFRQALFEGLAALPFLQRQTFLMYYEAALSINQIAEITDSDNEAVKSRLRYAVDKLKNRLGKDDA